MDPVSVKINLMRMTDIPEEAAEALSRAETVRIGGTIYIRSGNQALACPEGEAGEALLRALTARKEGQTGEREWQDPWQALLRGETGGLPAGIRNGIRRCVVLFAEMPGEEKTLTRQMWETLAPTERGDAATRTETGRIALIKQTEGRTEEETAEFAAAVIETIETETGIRIQAGIGSAVTEAAELRESLRQAREAVALGRIYEPEERVYRYSRQTMERLIDAVPAEVRKRLRKELLSAETGKELNGEMMETVEAFFRNDLNLSTTARELFIHRNTLIYRLDKIRKETGFDLRRFRDAAAFRMISRMPDDEK